MLLALGACEHASIEGAYALLDSDQPEEACTLLEGLANENKSSTITPERALATLLLVEAERQRDGAATYDAAAVRHCLDMLPRLVSSGEYTAALRAIDALSQWAARLWRINPGLATAYLEGAAAMMDGEGCRQRVAKAMFSANRAQLAADAGQDADKAVAWFEECLSVPESCDAAHLSFTCRAYSGLAKIAGAQQKLDDAEAHLRKAIDAAEKTEEHRAQLQAQCHTNLGALLLAQEKTDEAHEHFATGLKLLGNHPPPTLLVEALHGLAWVALRRAEYESSIRHNERALALVRDGNFPHETRAKIHHELGVAFTKTGQAPDARDHFNAALRTLRALPPASPAGTMIPAIEKQLAALPK